MSVKKKYKVYVYEAYTKVYTVEDDTETGAIIQVEQNGNRLVDEGEDKIFPTSIKIEEFRIEEAQQIWF